MGTYAFSDVHGRKAWYDRIFDTVRKDDRLFVLGDAIDRHPYGIDILIDIMRRIDDGWNIEFITGNHEFMMYESMFDENLFAKLRWRGTWVSMQNGGTKTEKAFLELDGPARKRIKEFIENSWVFRKTSVGKKEYMLCHGCVPRQMDGMGGMRFSDMLKRKDILENAVWESMLQYSPASVPVGRLGDMTYICGHVYVQRIGNINGRIKYQDNCIGIDGGCALPDSYADTMHPNLILYDMENDKALYIHDWAW